MLPSPTFRPAALQTALEVKIGRAQTYSLVVVELLDGDLKLTDQRSLGASYIQLADLDVATLHTNHGSYYIKVGQYIKMKMPSVELGKRWASELQEAIAKARTASSSTRTPSCSVSPCESPISDARRPQEHRIFAFPFEMMGVTMFDEKRECRGDSAVGSRVCSASTDEI